MASVVDVRPRSSVAEGEPAAVRSPDAAGPLLDLTQAGGVRGYLPSRPWLARDGRGRPVLSLTVVLARRPGPDEQDVVPLIERGHLSFDATLALPAGAWAPDATPAAPAFARSVVFRLTSPAAGTELTRALTSGPGAQAAVTAALDASLTRAVLDALSGLESGLALSAELVLDREPARARVSLGAGWAVLYDEIDRQAGGAPDFDVAVIERALQYLLRSGGLEVRTTAADPAGSDVLAVAIRGLLRSGGVILARTPGGAPGRYRLTERPDESFVWRYEETLALPSTLDLTVAASLEQVLGGALDGEDWELFVRLVAPEGPEGSYAPVPRRRAGDTLVVDRASDGDPVSSMVLVNATMVDSAAATATARPTVRPVALPSGEIRQLWLADGVLDYLGKGRVRSLPVTTGGDEVLFPDRLDAKRQWYVPALEIVEPDPAGNPDTSAFLFAFERIGTASTGDAALSAKVRITLRPAVPEAVQSALAALGNPPAGPVDMLDLDVVLSIPFIDAADNSPKRTALRGTIERSGGDVIVAFAIAAQWVRLAYAVLSPSDFPAGERPAIGYSFRYESYRATKGSLIRPLNGIKQALIPIEWNPRPAGVRPLAFDAAAGTLTAGATRIRFAPEEALSEPKEAAARGERGGTPAAAVNPAAIAVARPIAGRPGVTLTRPIGEIAVRPLPLEIRPPLIDVIPELRDRVYVQQSVGVQGAADLLMPCNRLGALYRQRLATGWQAVGCQDALRLGTASAQLYEEIGTLASPWIRVYRCLPQPGRFLALPRVYRIARYPPGHERGYLPAAMVYAALDPETAANNRYRFVATIEPDIPPFVMRGLRSALGAHAPPASIQIDLPTDVATQVALPSIPVASALAQPRFTVAGKGVQVVLECQLPDALILRSAIEAGGVLGRLSFTLDDASQLESDVEIVLGQIGGPWGAGPVSAVRTGDEVRLTNCIDRPVDVAAVRLYAGVAAVTEVAVGRRLEPLGSATVAVADGDAELAVVYAIPPGGARSLEECRVYMEDVSTNVIFTCGINYAARGIAEIEVSARLRGVVGSEQHVALSNDMPRTGTADFVAPLSSVVGSSGSSPEIEYRLARVMTAGERVEKAWAVCPGALVDIQWEQVA